MLLHVRYRQHLSDRQKDEHDQGENVDQARRHIGTSIHAPDLMRGRSNLNTDRYARDAAQHKHALADALKRQSLWVRRSCTASVENPRLLFVKLLLRDDPLV
jgi:hypothetical protein